MSKDKREINLNEIKSNQCIDVIVISFKAGNIGERTIFPSGAGENLDLLYPYG
jgi:hypothetical protein